MLDIVSTGDNLQEKSKVYLLEKYEKCFIVSPVLLCTRHRAKLRREVTRSTYENYINVNKIVIIPKTSSKFGHIICLYII